MQIPKKAMHRSILAGAMLTLLTGAMCATETGETTKELGVAAIQDFATNPLKSGAPLAGVILGSADLSKEAGRRYYEAQAVRVQLLANDAQGNNPALQARYEAEEALYTAAAECIATRACDELNKLQQEIRAKALLQQSLTQGGHSG